MSLMWLVEGPQRDSLSIWGPKKTSPDGHKGMNEDLWVCGEEVVVGFSGDKAMRYVFIKEDLATAGKLALSLMSFAICMND